MTEDTSKQALRESLSALVDNQASELELHRILKECEQDADVRETWGRYQIVSSALKAETPAGPYVDLSDCIRQAIADEAPLNVSFNPAESRQTSASTLGRWWQSAGRVAIAASVAGAVFFGAQQARLLASNDGNGNQVAESETVTATPDDNTPSMVSPLQTRTVGTDSGQIRASYNQPVTFIPRTPEQRIPNEVIQQRLNQLMLEHAEHAAQNSGRGMLPFARIPRVGEE